MSKHLCSMCYHRNLGTARYGSFSVTWHAALCQKEGWYLFKHLQWSSERAESHWTQFNGSSLPFLSPWVFVTSGPRRGNAYLVAEIYISVSRKKQRHHVHVAILRGKMDRGNTLPGYSVGISTVFQQCSRYVHLVFLGSYVQWRIAVLWTESTSLQATH